MAATHIKKIKQCMLFVTCAYLRDMINTIFVILHLNVSRLNEWTYLFTGKKLRTLICFIVRFCKVMFVA